MPYKSVFSALYNLSLAEITIETASLSPNFASNLNMDLDQQIDLICEFPGLFPVFEYNDELNMKNPLRKMVLTGYNYVVYYSVDDSKNEIKLIDVLHASRDAKTILASNISKFN